MRKLYSAAIVILALFSVSPVKAQELREKTVQDLVKANAAQLHISNVDADNATINSYFTDPSTGITYTYIQQTWNGIKVYNTIITAAFRNNKLLYTSGKFVNDIGNKASQPVPSLAADQAVIKSAEHLQLATPSNLQTVENKFASDKKIILSPAGIARQNISAELFWVTDDNLQNVKLAWNINIDVAGSTDWWNVRVDAINGNVIEKDNWTVHENIPGFKSPGHSTATVDASNSNKRIISNAIHTGNRFMPTSVTNASYRVIRFPGESPAAGTIVVENEPWLKAGAGNNAITHGWHYDGNNDYNITRGNNVWAYLDILNTNTVSLTNCPDTSSTAIPNLTFNNTPTFTDPPSTTTNRKFAVDNLFYWNNLMHDVMYQYGFNEVSGNFQADNLGRGGSGNDFVRAESQDASGMNNANFSTPADGSSGRMQMYLFARVPSLVVNSPAAIAGNYVILESNFSTNNQLINTGPVTGDLVYYEDGGVHEACTTPPSNVLTGKIALIIRGNCNFTVKVKNAQDAGAIGVVMVNNVPGDPIIMGGTDNTITIPAVMISQADGAIIAAQLANNVNVTMSAGVNRDGDLDNGVVCHEYGHGISNRLTGGRTNASCLSNAEEGGEGWSDYFALMMVTNWSTTQLTGGSVPRSMGTYVLGQATTGSGIRLYPYTINMTLNPHTYADLANVSTEVHDIGEVWASALWDMTWNIIAQEGSIEPNIYNANSNGGNAIALRLVMEGLRLQTCRPGFLDARNAILAADSILYNYRHKCAIWNAFARRGMGVSAVQGSSSNATDQVAAFDVPAAVTLSKSATPVKIDQSEQVTINLSATCGCQTPANNYTIKDTIPAGFTYISSTGGSLSGNIVTFSPVNFSTALETKNYSITIQPSVGGCNVDTAINDNRDGATIGGLTPVTLSGTTDWVPSNIRSSSPSNSWFAANPAATTDFTLTSNAFVAGNLSILSLKHYYVMENSVDGGRIEISNDNGTTWVDAGPYIVRNGYNTVMNATSAWGNNEKAFSGVSYGQGSNQFINTIVDLSSFSGQSIRVRLRMRTNSTNASNSTYEGWYVDDILHMNGCGGIVKAGLYNPSAALIDNTIFPVFVKAGSSTSVTFTTQPNNASACENSTATFAATASGTPAPTYKWQVSTDGGATYNDIPGQTSSILSFTATAAMNGYKYRSVADNGVTSATSNAVTLTVNRLVTVTTHPANASACGGTNANFSVAGTGSGTLTYKWQVSSDGGTTFTDIPGQTAATLTVAVVNGMNNYKYRAVVTGTCGPATSNAGTLTVAQQTPVTLTSLPSKICVSDSTLSLIATPVGGTWSGTGVSANTFVPSSTAAGNYTLTYTYTNAGGCITTATIPANVDACTDRNILLSDNAIILYPNPNNGQFYIKLNSALYKNISMKVYGYNGALVRTQELTGLAWGRIVPINLSNLAASVYMLRFSANDGTKTVEKSFKVIIAGH